MNGRTLTLVVALVSLVGLTLAAIVALTFSPNPGTAITVVLALVGPVIASIVSMLRADEAKVTAARALNVTEASTRNLGDRLDELAGTVEQVPVKTAEAVAEKVANGGEHGQP